MADPTHTQYSVCVDCYEVILVGEATCLDYHYAPDDAETRYQAIKRGEERVRAAHGERTVFVLHPNEERDEFSTAPCEFCLSQLAGERFSCWAVNVGEIGAQP